MSHRHEVFFVAGEPSGDLHAAALAQELAEMADVRLTGAGGPRMHQAEVTIDFDSAEWGTVGIPEALRRVPYLFMQKHRIARLIKRRQPALVVLVDFGAFNVRLARLIRQLRPQQRILYYFPPSSWRRQPRDWTFLKEVADAVATPFKWSAQLLRDCGVRAYWVGHPVVERFSAAEDTASFRHQHGLPGGEPVIGLLPGSRTIERRCLGPQLLRAAQVIKNDLPTAHFLWSVWNPEQPSRLDARAAAADYITPLDDSRTLILGSDIVITASGTATLEAAAAGRPMIMVYRGTWAMVLQYRLSDLGTEYYAMPNIIAQRQIVPELLQADVNPQRLRQEVLRLYEDKSVCQQMKQDLTQVRAALGPPGASRRAAQLALALMDDSLPPANLIQPAEGLG